MRFAVTSFAVTSFAVMSCALAQTYPFRPIRIIAPREGVAYTRLDLAMLKNAPHANAARLFMNYYYSKEYSETMAKTYNYPLRPDVPSPTGKSPDQIKSYRNKGERLQTGIPEVVAKWRETFGV